MLNFLSVVQLFLMIVEDICESSDLPIGEFFSFTIKLINDLKLIKSKKITLYLKFFPQVAHW